MIPVTLIFDDSILNIRPNFNRESVTVVPMSRVPNIGEFVEIYLNIYSQAENFTVTKVVHWVLLEGDFRTRSQKLKLLLLYKANLDKV
jgi:hypothetical protein